MIVRVRNLRVAVVTVRDAVVIVILVGGVRLTVTIGIQLEVRIRLIGAAIRVRHRHRNIELLNGVLVQLRLIRERHRDLTGVLINLDLIPLRSLEVSRNRELRTLRSLSVLTILASEGRGRLGLLARNNQLALIRRLEGVCRNVRYLEGCVSARDNTALGLRFAGFVLDRVTILVENWNLQSPVTHDHWEVERLSQLSLYTSIWALYCASLKCCFDCQASFYISIC